jgi:hypothetical protein
MQSSKSSAGSHLAMRGAAGKAIQELAGHQELGTTQRYMHLSPEARESAIRLLEQPKRNPRMETSLWRRGKSLTQVETTASG